MLSSNVQRPASEYQSMYLYLTFEREREKGKGKLPHMLSTFTYKIKIFFPHLQERHKPHSY